MATKLAPLSTQVPIVDKDGNPTPYFQQLMQILLNEKNITDALAAGALPDSASTGIILGRQTAGSGPIEELTLSQALDLIGSAAQGDILYRGASGWARLPAGTSGNFLKTQGTGANPTWDSVSASGATGARVTKSTQNIGNNIFSTASYISFDTLVHDDGGFWNASFPTRLTAP